ncbi:MAG: toxic anion resistance protein [Oscillospiraceae bacterium]|nr:toxic anion resistance protein [Oscillospiraceae bacterium]
MAENTAYTPTLTLKPDSASAVAVAELTDEEALAKRDAVAVKLDISQLTEEERKQVEDFSEKIDITDTNAVLTYGAASQRNISDFSETTLKSVRTKDMGEVGEMLSSLVVQLRGFNYGEEEKKGLFGIKKKVQNRIATIKAEYDNAETNVDKIAAALEQHQVVLLKDAAMLDKMYEINQTYFKELTMYILAGKKKLEECKSAALPELQTKARETGLPEDAQKVNDYMNMINRFEKKLYDLELTRMISIQMAPQIRLIQNNDSLMVEKIQTSIVNTIPLWKSQMVLALGMHHARQAMDAQREVSNMTNELLRRNADALKTGTIEIARESERGIADIETLVATNQSLIETLEEVRSIQIEGSAKRRAAEAELGRIEGELKQKLLSLKSQ